MGIDRNGGIKQTTIKTKDFSKKQASGKDSNADQTQILSVSARLSTARSKLQNARSQSQGQGLVFLDNPKQTARKESSDAQIKAPPPNAAAKQQSQNKEDIAKAQIINFRAETLEDISSLESDKAALQSRIDAAVLEDSGENISELRDDYSMVNDASNTSKDHDAFLKSEKLETKDPQLLQEIHNKKNEILSLSFDKSKGSELSTAKQDLDSLKAQLFAQ